MPAGNGTGPDGEGRMTGRGLGYCTGYQQPGYSKSGFGRRNRSAWWIGRSGIGVGAAGRMRSYSGFASQSQQMQPPTLEEEEHVLKEQSSWLQSQLDFINARLDAIQKEKSTTA
ncbi:MAG: hypothetical protein C4545_02410 [Anaerolineaceae bacterium]|jgi:hypothetical protein|nr:MAG: hypothetical protein C4545_02410 [Anaerolineaceae bacterium]